MSGSCDDDDVDEEEGDIDRAKNDVDDSTALVPPFFAQVITATDEDEPELASAASKSPACDERSRAAPRARRCDRGIGFCLDRIEIDLCCSFFFVSEKHRSRAAEGYKRSDVTQSVLERCKKREKNVTNRLFLFR